MTIEELKERKATLEEELHTAFEKIINSFQADTGGEPDSVNIELEKYETLNGKQIIPVVNVEIKL